MLAYILETAAGHRNAHTAERLAERLNAGSSNQAKAMRDSAQIQSESANSEPNSEINSETGNSETGAHSMLRAFLIGFGLLSVMVALYWIADGEIRPAVWLAGNGAALTLGVLFERLRYTHGAATFESGQFVPTGEEFLDPETDALIEVHMNPITGERHYVSTGFRQRTGLSM